MSEIKLGTKELLQLNKIKKEHRATFNLTKLPEEQEVQFQQFIKSSAWYKEFTKDFGGPPDLDDPNYDYRGAWEEMGADMFALDEESGKIHGFDRAPSGKWLKSPEHPTVFKQYLQELEQ